MQSRRTESDTAIEESTISRPWDNSGLRHRVEGRAIDGIDIRSLQSSVVARSGASTTRRRSLRERSPAASPQIERTHDLDREAS
jgi:hypothetical protein